MIQRLHTADIAIRLGLAISALWIGSQFLLPPFGDGLFYDRFGPIQAAAPTVIPIVQLTAFAYFLAALFCISRRTMGIAGGIFVVLSASALLSTRISSFLGMKDLPILAGGLCLVLLSVRMFKPTPRLILTLLGAAFGISMLYHGYTMLALVYHLPSPIPTLIYLELMNQAPVAVWLAARIGIEPVMVVLGVAEMCIGFMAFFGWWREWVSFAVMAISCLTLLLFGLSNHLFIREYAIIGSGLAIVALSGPWVYVRTVAPKRSRLFPLPDTVPARRYLKTITRRTRAW